MSLQGYHTRGLLGRHGQCYYYLYMYCICPALGLISSADKQLSSLYSVCRNLGYVLEFWLQRRVEENLGYHFVLLPMKIR